MCFGRFLGFGVIVVVTVTVTVPVRSTHTIRSTPQLPHISRAHIDRSCSAGVYSLYESNCRKQTDSQVRVNTKKVDMKIFSKMRTTIYKLVRMRGGGEGSYNGLDRRGVTKTLVHLDNRVKGVTWTLKHSSLGLGGSLAH